MVDFGDELDLGSLERVVVREVEVHSEATSHKRSGFGSLDVNVPDHDIILSGLNGDSWDWLSCKITKFLPKNNNQDVKRIVYTLEMEPAEQAGERV